MNDKRWKYFGVMATSIFAILLILLINANSKITKLTKVNCDQKEQIIQLNTELKNSIQSLEYLYFNQIEIGTILKNNTLTIGDTLVALIGLVARNFILDSNDNLIEPTILLGTGIDHEGNLLGPFDTVPVNSWQGHLINQTKELGTHTIYGLYKFPEIKNFNGMQFPFSFMYTVIEK